MSERDEKGRADDEATEKKPSRGYRIPGRDLAGASYGADEEEQTADRRLESEHFRLDDGRLVGDADQDHPRDES
ncbi:MAG: hypothetical protein ACJ79S_02730 [Gemmatimonadaceae bacterium]